MKGVEGKREDRDGGVGENRGKGEKGGEAKMERGGGVGWGRGDGDGGEGCFRGRRRERGLGKEVR